LQRAAAEPSGSCHWRVGNLTVADIGHEFVSGNPPALRGRVRKLLPLNGKEGIVTSGSVAMVTGASRGIGRATAIRLASDFAAVVITARTQEELQKTATAVRSAGAQPLLYVLDLCDSASAEILVQGTLEHFGRIDALLNIAGAVPRVDLFHMTDTQWDEGFALQFHGARRLTIRAWDVLKKCKGSVVMLSRTVALAPGFAAASAATDAAVIALAKAFAEKGIQDGVQVNSVAPGAILRRRQVLEKGAISRYGTPKEVAGLMAYLVSREARWLTGASIRMDGGEIKGIQ
jgi:3-oxoacyl-[acyl-carrier protein] reductase